MLSGEFMIANLRKAEIECIMLGIKGPNVLMDLAAMKVAVSSLDKQLSGMVQGKLIHDAPTLSARRMP
jgi:hypothetical protein